MARWLCLVLARLALGEVIPLDATTELRVCAANVLRITKCLGCLAEVMAGMNIIDHQAGENEGKMKGNFWGWKSVVVHGGRMLT